MLQPHHLKIFANYTEWWEVSYDQHLKSYFWHGTLNMPPSNHSVKWANILPTFGQIVVVTSPPNQGKIGEFLSWFRTPIGLILCANWSVILLVQVPCNSYWANDITQKAILSLL